MKYVPAQPPVTRDPQQVAEFLMRELRRISDSIGSLVQDGWDDLKNPAQSINLAGSPAPPAIDDTVSAAAATGTLLFSGSLENVIAGIQQVPHAVRLGVPLYPHIHWSLPGGGASTEGVTWVFYYKHLGNPSATFGAWVGPWTGSFVVGNPAIANQHLITEFSLIDMSNVRESACIAWRIHRLGNADSLNATARLIEFDLHARHDRFGSPGIYGGPA